ncbi:hypothetical protein Pmani_037083 [Petrolisthes manimaculis]|uniref:Uncharacterized protein n=1 Tax=Petrolisthes manimaculis TaxID=1843537 RepID=A0AAE1NJ47_9EUCA|nr:hypothetical protein Pmani_037083 [Petrolisthes manimaculis]
MLVGVEESGCWNGWEEDCESGGVDEVGVAVVGMESGEFGSGDGWVTPISGVNTTTTTTTNTTTTITTNTTTNTITTRRISGVGVVVELKL